MLEREAMMGTGLGDGIAVPHARLAGLESPLVVAGASDQGIDFDAPDGEPVQLVFLILTPRDDGGAQVQILGAIARLLQDPKVRHEAMTARTATAFLAALRIGDVMRNADEGPSLPTRRESRDGLSPSTN